MLNEYSAENNCKAIAILYKNMWRGDKRKTGSVLKEVLEQEKLITPLLEYGIFKVEE